MRIDLHVHTARHSPCAERLAPERLAERARAAGLRGVVLSEHDTLWDPAAFAALRDEAESHGVRLYRGMEFSVRGAHLLMYGLRDLAGLGRRMAFDDAVAVAHAQGAAVVLAHPYRSGDPETLPLHLVDAIEVASSSVSAQDVPRAVELARRLGKPTVAGSDAHALPVVGWASTLFRGLPVDETALAAAIRDGAGLWARDGEFFA